MSKERKHTSSHPPLVIADGRTLGVVGAGVMGQTLIRGILTSGVIPRERLWAGDKSASACEKAGSALQIPSRWIAGRIVWLGLCLSLLGVQTLAAGETKVVRARWDELPVLVEGRNIDTVLRDGLHVKGKVTAVTPEGLQIRVTSTSDSLRMRTGAREIARERLTMIQIVTGRKGLARAILSPLLALGGFGVVVFMSAAEVWGETSTGGTAAAVVAFPAIGAVAGYALGARLDRNLLIIRVIPDTQ